MAGVLQLGSFKVVGKRSPYSDQVGNSPGTGPGDWGYQDDVSQDELEMIPFWEDITTSTLDPSHSFGSPWDFFWVQGHQLPGLAEVDIVCHQHYDHQKGKGKKTERLVYVGDHPAQISVTLRLWTRQQLALLFKYMPILKPPRGSLNHSRAIQVSHPALTVLGINAMVVEDVGTLKKSSTVGVREMVIKGREYWGGSDDKQDFSQTTKGTVNDPDPKSGAKIMGTSKPSATDTGPH